MKSIIALAFYAFIGTASAAGVYDFRAGTYQDDGGARASSGSMVDMAKNAVKRQMLVGSDRVRFRQVRTVTARDGNQVICGEYNAINLGGSYQGYNKFAYSDKGVVLASKKKSSSGFKEIDAEFEKNYRTTISKIRSMGCG